MFKIIIFIIAVLFCIKLFLMLCGCLNKKKATLDLDKQMADSPLQIKLIKMFGLKQYIMQKFVFRRKPSSYQIRKVQGKNRIFIGNEQYHSPMFYKSQVQILQIHNHSIPVIRISPITVKQQEVIPCVIYVHGNSSDLGDSIKFINDMIPKFKAEYIVFDFTGYGESRKANIGEEIICKDLQYVMAWANRPLNEIILWGFSLGSYPVIFNAAKYNVKAIILQCPIGSLSCMFYEQYDTNIKFNDDHFANIDHIMDVKSKILMIHSMADEIIPIEQAQLLYKKYTNRYGDKDIEFIQVQNIKHNGLHKYLTTVYPNDLQKQFIMFLNSNKESMQSHKHEEQKSIQLMELTEQLKKVTIEEYFEENQFELLQSEQSNRTKQGQMSWFCYQK